MHPTVSTVTGEVGWTFAFKLKFPLECFPWIYRTAMPKTKIRSNFRQLLHSLIPYRKALITAGIPAKTVLWLTWNKWNGYKAFTDQSSIQYAENKSRKQEKTDQKMQQRWNEIHDHNYVS